MHNMYVCVCIHIVRYDNFGLVSTELLAEHILMDDFLKCLSTWTTFQLFLFIIELHVKCL